MQRKQRPLPNGGRGVREMMFFIKAHANTANCAKKFISQKLIESTWGGRLMTAGNWLLRADNYAIGSGQKSLRLQALQWRPIHSSSNWFMACSTIAGSSVRIPASKLRLSAVFMPMPAPVRLALPMYTCWQSNISILKCTRGHSTLSRRSYSTG